MPVAVQAIEMIESIEIVSALIKAEAGARVEIRKRRLARFHARHRRLMASGQHALLEDLIACRAHAVLHHHVRRQIGAFAAETVGHP